MLNPEPGRPSIWSSVAAARASAGNRWGNRMRRHNIASILVRLVKTAGIRAHVTPHALRRSYMIIGLQQGVSLREMQRAARHTKADRTIAYDQSDRHSTATQPSCSCLRPPGSPPSAAATVRFGATATPVTMGLRARPTPTLVRPNEEFDYQVARLRSSTSEAYS